MKSIQLFSILFVFCLCWSCTEDTIVGSNLLSNEDIDVQFTDTFSFTAKTVESDSVITFIPGNGVYVTYLMGRLEDNLFGTAESEIFLDAGITGNSSNPDFDEVEMSNIDSIVLVLKVDSAGVYGDPNASFDFEVFRMTEKMTEIDTFYSTQEFTYDGSPIGMLSGFTYNTSDSVELIELQDTFMREAQIRIPLDIALAEELVEWAKTTDTLSDASFREQLNGLAIKATPSSSAMIGVDLSEVAYETELSELAIYYSQDTLENRKYGFSTGLRKTNHFEMNRTGYAIQDAIDGGNVIGDSILFVQSMQGTNLELDLSEVKSIEDQLLNYAELEFFVLERMDNDLDQHPPVDILILSSENEDGELIVLEDLSVVNIFPELEEVEVNGMNVWRYQMVVTRYVQDIINDIESGNNLTISAILRSQRPNRSILCGPKHSTYPSKLKLALTNL